MDPKIVPANENISADKLEQLPKITGSVYITYQASGELAESHAEKPKTYPEGRDRRPQDTAAFSPGLTREQESRHKGSAAGNQPGNAAVWRFLTKLFPGVGEATTPSPNQAGHVLEDNVDTQNRCAGQSCFCVTPPVSKARPLEVTELQLQGPHLPVPYHVDPATALLHSLESWKDMLCSLGEMSQNRSIYPKSAFFDN